MELESHGEDMYFLYFFNNHVEVLQHFALQLFCDFKYWVKELIKIIYNHLSCYNIIKHVEVFICKLIVSVPSFHMSNYNE